MEQFQDPFLTSAFRDCESGMPVSIQYFYFRAVGKEQRGYILMAFVDCCNQGCVPLLGTMID